MSTAEGWQPGIGDPTFLGWLTVLAYAAAAVLCNRETWLEPENGPRKLFWSLLSVVMLFLGVNKQLDLQTWLTFTGRHLARSQGWYGQRRTVQLIFILLFTSASLAAFGATWRLVRDHGEDLRLPLAGLFVVATFVVVRAASFHHIDELLHTRLAGFKMNWILELGGIALTIAGALRADRNQQNE